MEKERERERAKEQESKRAREREREQEHEHEHEQEQERERERAGAVLGPLDLNSILPVVLASTYSIYLLAISGACEQGRLQKRIAWHTIYITVCCIQNMYVYNANKVTDLPSLYHYPLLLPTLTC